MWPMILVAMWGCRTAPEPVDAAWPPPPADDPGRIVAVRVPDGSALTDPDAAFWRHVPASRVALVPQNVVPPLHQSPAVTSLVARAAHDGRTIAVHLIWDDATRSDELRSDSFGDQVALQLPVDPAGPAPSPMMGHKGAPVRLLQWRAALQRDLDHGPVTVASLYPNFAYDIYPDELLPAHAARPYDGARALGNPIAVGRERAVIAHVAEGWSSLTALADQRADGRGLWRDGAWYVTIAHPLQAADGDVVPVGGETVAAFAAWDGGHREVGGRKSWSAWVPLEVAP